MPKKFKYINLALQGGGAHGAYTWGVLDRLLDDPSLVVEGISGTSAGSLNAAIFVSGYSHNGVAGARKALHDFWQRVSEKSKYNPIHKRLSDIYATHWNKDYSPYSIGMDIFSRLFSPYDSPIDLNPLRDILIDSIDFTAIIHSPIKLLITATQVKTGRGIVFRNKDITLDVLLASCCLPLMFKAIEIDGESYWDGGYTGNPTLSPLVQESKFGGDIILVQLNPVEREETPRTSRDIVNRINEVAFNSTLIKELKMLALLRQVDSSNGKWANLRIHRIINPEMVNLAISTKLNAEWSFLQKIFKEGRKNTHVFLKKHYQDINHCSTYDLNFLL